MTSEVDPNYRRKVKHWTENRPLITAFLTVIAIGTGWAAGSIITGTSFSGVLVGSIAAAVTAFTVRTLIVFFRQ